MNCNYCDNKGYVPLIGPGTTGVTKICPVCKGKSKK